MKGENSAFKKQIAPFLSSGPVVRPHPASRIMEGLNSIFGATNAMLRMGETDLAEPKIEAKS